MEGFGPRDLLEAVHGRGATSQEHLCVPDWFVHLEQTLEAETVQIEIEAEM